MLSFLQNLLARPLTNDGPFVMRAAPVRGGDWPARMIPVNHPMVPALLQGCGYVVGNTPGFVAPAMDANQIRPAVVVSNIYGNGISVASTPRLSALIDGLMAQAVTTGKG